MARKCRVSFDFPGLGQAVVARFGRGQPSPDGGAVLRAAFDDRLARTRRLAAMRVTPGPG